MVASLRNRLEYASSPYLRQHAGNPVAWQPWDDTALGHARETDTPILLSIGYSACHWCHVMAHESFEEPAIAEAMNARFVNIKLDREERPDIDHAYQLAHQALRGRGGGWPLTAFLDPQDLSPIFIGTYFPPTPRHGLPGFTEVLARVRAWFDGHRDETRAQAGQLRVWLEQFETGSAGTSVAATTANDEALRRTSARFDPRWGGDTGAPKFPRAAMLEWLLDLRDPGGTARGMAGTTLATMARRGLQDHLGGGFFRYCVDAAWTIPHFEKMLYDNAQLLPVYARIAASDAANPALRQLASAAAHGIVDWLESTMAAPDGLFYSSLDADSEHEEGKFYVWTREQLHACLSDPGLDIAEHAFGLDQPANFEDRAWHLLRDVPLAEVAQRLGLAAAATEDSYAAARRSLLDARSLRAAPARDDKLLTGWNALAISGLARSARLLEDARCARLARRGLTALRRGAWVNTALYANVAAPHQRIPGFLDDYAFTLDAVLEVLQLDFDASDVAWAIALADALLAQFENRHTGGFWFSTPQHATPLIRGCDWTDDALPNGNAVAIRSLLRLGHLVGDARYLDSAERALKSAAGALQRHPDACATLLRSLDEFEQPRTQVVVCCLETRSPDWRAALREGLQAAGFAPGGDPVDAFIIPSQVHALPGLLATRAATGGPETAYVCSGLTCRAPITSPAALARSIRDAQPD